MLIEEQLRSGYSPAPGDATLHAGAAIPLRAYRWGTTKSWTAQYFEAQAIDLRTNVCADAAAENRRMVVDVWTN